MVTQRNPANLATFESFKHPHVTVTSNACQLSSDAEVTTSSPTTTSPTTMTSRRQSRRVTKADVDYKEDANSAPSEDEVVPVPTKKRKTAGGGQKETSKRRKGKLSRLPDMPLDVLYEVTPGKPRGTERH